MSISLISAMLPTVQSSLERGGRSLQIRVARLVLTIANQAADAVCNSRYKDFDALIKNFGCQITALEIRRIVEKPQIVDEAKNIRLLARSKIAECKNLLGKSIKSDMSMVAFMQAQGVDMEVSGSFLRLVRFRTLCLINNNKPSTHDPQREMPFTDCAPLVALDTKLGNYISKWIESIQVDESKKAVSFLQQEVSLLEGVRAPLLKKILSPQNVRRTKTGIESFPLLYNTEAVFQRIEGIVLIKQKLFFCGAPIDAPKYTLFLELPNEKILEEREIALLPPKTPIFVVEGYVKTAHFVDEVTRIGFDTILKANCGSIPQYAAGSDQSILGDEEADHEIAKYKGMKNMVDQIFEIDHIFLASLGEAL